MLCHSIASWEDAPGGLSFSEGGSVRGVAPVICFPSFCRFAKCLVMKDQMEVCSLSRRGMLHLVSTLLLGGFCFLHPPVPASPSVSFARDVPTSGRDAGFPRSVRIPGRVRRCLFAGGCWVCVREIRSHRTEPRTFWFKPLSIFGLLRITTFISSSHVFVIPSALAPELH